MKVLVFCPMSPRHPRIFGRTVESILRLDYAPLHFKFHYGDNPHKKAYPNITRNYNIAREDMLSGGYDALLTIESDMVVPRDTVTKLTKCLQDGADIAYGLYVWRHGSRRWSAYFEMSGLTGKSISTEPDMAREAWGKTVPVVGVGLGCTLISRHVLERFTFRIDDPLCSCDWWLAMDAQDAGYRQVCDTSVACGHITLKPALQTIWPDIAMDRLYRIDYQAPVPKENVRRLPNGDLEILIDQMGDTPIPLEVPV